MKFTFLRHGYAAHNKAFDELGEVAYTMTEYKDSALLPKGFGQAQEVILPHIPDRIYCSPLRRCIETATTVVPNRMLNLDDGLIERQGEHPANLRSTIPTIQSYSNLLDVTDCAEILYYDQSVREPMVPFKERVVNTMNRIIENCLNDALESVLIVTHCDVLEALFNRQFKNCEHYTIILDSPSFPLPY